MLAPQVNYRINLSQRLLFLLHVVKSHRLLDQCELIARLSNILPQHDDIGNIANQSQVISSTPAFPVAPVAINLKFPPSAFA